MSHLIDPCLRATKIAHGIRRGIDGISPLSGLVPELRILIQEQKNVLTSLKRTTFEKEEAAKHLAIYAKTEGPDIADTLSKLGILIQKAADLERDYADSLAQSRELFKEVRHAEDENYSVRKRKLDLEQKLSLERTSTSTSGRPGSVYGPEVHPEMQLLRKETMTVENDLEDLKRKKIKTAAIQQLSALEKLGKEMVVIAHYGRLVMGQLDDTPTPAGTHADDRFATYDGEAKTAYSVKACLDTFKNWAEHEPQIQIVDIDLGDYPRDNKEAMDAMLKELATKSGSDWYSLQSPTSKTSASHGRTSSISSASSASPRHSISSVVTTTTYVDGVPTVKVINEIPPTPELEEGPVKGSEDSKDDAETTASTAQEAIPIFVADATTTDSGAENPQTATNERTEPEEPKPTNENNTAFSASTTTGAGSPSSSPFVPHSTYKPSTTYYPSHPGQALEGRISPQPKSRPHSGEHQFPLGHAPHPLMMQQLPQPHRQQIYPPGPPGGLSSPVSMPLSMPMPKPLPMPVPYIPSSPDGDNLGASNNKRTSQPISVSFPMYPPRNTSPTPGAFDHGGIAPATISSSSSPQQHSHSRNPHAVLPPTEPGFRIPPESQMDDNVYDGPPPDYVEASMLPPAEKRDKKD
ncbi:hypothetical protein BGZ80_003130 [Entomortierella chlamydospora]|uniref:Eisosome component PIL1-domain-containing protein n=1 Tax=Entomortierella chlamydospora TaxID=101097 RepID=A0A9P6T2X9_9FUNG|nr:hypothetical protein BGZ80_003130 [Entomortierella chlamydospora]